MNEPGPARPLGQATPPTGNLDIVQLRDRFEFLRGFVRHPARVGSIAPSYRKVPSYCCFGAA